MSRKKRIYKLLSNELKDFSLDIIDNSNLHIGHNNFNGKGETHILLKLTPKKIVKFNRIQIHRKINKILEKEFDEGLHSLEINIINF